ncbi:MAG: HIT family protein [Pseudohongiellaceae bacterium]
MKQSDCPFCQIINGSAPERILVQNSKALAILDGYPVSNGHSLIVLWRHAASLFETDAGERHAMFELLNNAKTIIDGLHQPDSYNIGINDGASAGQTVPHLHIHLIPRYKGDMVDPRGGVRWVIPDKADYWSRNE